MRSRQMVIGDQDVDAEPLRAGDSFDAGDAVVDGDDEPWSLLVRDLHDLRGQPVAVTPAIRHHESHVGGPEQAQAPHRDGASGRAVGIVVADHHDARRGLDRVVEQRGRAVEIDESVRREQAREGVIEIAVAADGARREHPAQDGVVSGEEPRTGLRRRPTLDASHVATRGSRDSSKAGKVIRFSSSRSRDAMAPRSVCERIRGPATCARRRFSPRAPRAATTGSVPGESRRTDGHARRGSRPGGRRRGPGRRAAASPMMC